MMGQRKKNEIISLIHFYYTGGGNATNKLQKVTGSVNQYYYDANGNVIVDSVKQNYYIKYDWRNLITELRHWRLPPGGGDVGVGGGEQQIWVYKANYWYDEAGNRICKKTFVWQPSGQIEPRINSVEQIVEEGDNPTGTWNILETIYYVRDVTGKEIAIYSGNSVERCSEGVPSGEYVRT